MKNYKFAVILFLASIASAQTNWGWVMPPNGPCVPWPNAAGICSDNPNGVFTLYDVTGKKTTLQTLLSGIVGPAGPPGQAATVQIGTVTTGSPGSQASVTNSGSSSAAVLNFSIPAGQTGQQGPQGVPGNGFAVGTVLTVTQQCPRGVGTIQAGWTSQNCTVTITAIP